MIADEKIAAHETISRLMWTYTIGVRTLQARQNPVVAVIDKNIPIPTVKPYIKDKLMSWKRES